MTLGTANWWLEAVLGFFYPPVCQCCRAEPAGAAQGYVGLQCRRGVRPVRPPYCERCGLPFAGEMASVPGCAHCESLDLGFDWARSAVCATATVLDVVRRYKYGGETWLEPFLGELLVGAAAPEIGLGAWTMLVPVPLHPLKVRERGFNQALRLARRLGRATGLPVTRSALRRRKFTLTQTQFSRSERLTNVRGAFDYAGQVDLVGHRVILVDDVFTTGATTSECARVLKQAGAEQVGVWTVVRGMYTGPGKGVLGGSTGH